MKKVVATLMITGICVAAHAQFYLQGGLNLANITNTNDGQTEKNHILPTFNAGFMGRFDLSETFDFETGLLLSGHGSKAETYYNNGTDYVKTKFNPLYLQIPFNAVFKIPLQPKTDKSNIFFNVGPYLAIGIAGQSKSSLKFGPLESNASKDIKFSNDDPFTSAQDDAAYDKLKRFDFGFNVGGGIDFGKLILKANYGFGLAKINSTQSDNDANDKNKYRTLSVSVGIPLRN